MAAWIEDVSVSAGAFPIMPNDKSGRIANEKSVQVPICALRMPAWRTAIFGAAQSGVVEIGARTFGGFVAKFSGGWLIG
jgi:hypothetical protein